jgi:hypothetical protein
MEETPQAPPSGELGQPGARAYSDQGNVRPADGRFLGDASDDVPPQDLEAIREEEIARGYERLARQKQAEEEANQERLEATGYVNPTVAESDALVAQRAAFAKVHGEPGSIGNDGKPLTEPDQGPDAPDRYTAMDYAGLQAEARDRDGVKGNLPMEELRAALRADDADKADQ